MTSHYLDVAIGLSYTFLALSLLCSATREAIASLFQTRAKVLLDGVLTLLHEPAYRSRLCGLAPSLMRLLRRDDGCGLSRLGPHSLSAAVMTHPLIIGLAQPGRLPSYIPSAIFARAFIATLSDRYGKAHSAPLLLAGTGNEALSRTLLALMGDQQDDVAALELAVRLWYDTVMDRITGWYKRRTQLVLFGVGLVLACALNIDALALCQRLWRDQGAAAVLAQQGVDAIAAGRLKPDVITAAPVIEVRKDSELLQSLPIGWPSARFDNVRAQGSGAWLVALVFALLGWTITAFAASLGAPFWFDGIGWLLALRGTGVKPPAAS